MHLVWKFWDTNLGFFCFLFWLHCVACGILVPRPGIVPMPPAVEAQSPNHWTAREFPETQYFFLTNLPKLESYYP